MTFGASGWVSVVELIVYIPAALLSIFICSRHGFTRSSGWIYTLILCVVRIAGAICQLLTYHDTSSGLIQATLIIDSIGLSPLLFATLGMLSRFVDWVNGRSNELFTTKHFRLIQVLISVGLILSIAGGTSGSVSSDDQVHVVTTTKVAIVLYVVAFIAIIFVLFMSMTSASIVPYNERRTSLAVLAALPFIAARLLYSTLSVFVHNHWFNIVNGSVAVRVAMAVVEEFIVVIIYLILGFTLEKLEVTQQGPILSRPWKERKGGRGNDRHVSRRDQHADPALQSGASYQPPYQYVQGDDRSGVSPTPRAYSPGHVYGNSVA